MSCNTSPRYFWRPGVGSLWLLSLEANSAEKSRKFCFQAGEQHEAIQCDRSSEVEMDGSSNSSIPLAH